jgi:hypothetical protein
MKLPMTQAQQDYYRQAFELITGAIADRRWKQIKNELRRSGMRISIDSIQNYAQFKLHYPRTVLTKSAVKAVEEFQSQYKNRREFLGEELLDILHQINPKVSERTLINAFYKARLPFSKQNVYHIEESAKIVFFAATARRK